LIGFLEKWQAEDLAKSKGALVVGQEALIMMTKEENDLLTQTGPGTPCGELMRRYWQPAALSEEVPLGGAPKPIRLFGEDLVLFRDDQGRPGLLGLHCSHRGAELSYGRLEDGGLRCIYHGWLYDVHGRCLDQPGEPGGGEHGESIRHPAYPCIERAGAIFAYTGPGEPPLFPKYEFLVASEDRVFVSKVYHECNYLQANEGNIDLSHLTFLHYTYLNRGIGGRGASWEGDSERSPTEDLCSRGAAPTAEMADAELTTFGVRSYKIRRDFGPDKYQLYLTEFVLPNLTVVPGELRGVGGYFVNWHVPIDDEHHWKYVFNFSREKPLDKESLRRRRLTEATPDYKPIRNKSSRYSHDRASMKKESYTGLGFQFVIHDLWATEGQGPIQDRTKEHLGSMDKAIVMARKVLEKAIRDLQEGREPANVVRNPAANRFRLVTLNEVLPASNGWKERAKELEASVKTLEPAVMA
jgi:phenylpropionate dioxygenase-like ring-hydroxylating dioxygenase large terminal subunit